MTAAQEDSARDRGPAGGGSDNAPKYTVQGFILRLVRAAMNDARDGATISIPALTDRALDALLDEHPQTFRAYLAQMVRPLVYMETSRLVARSRRGLILLDDMVAGPEETVRRVRERSRKWESWFEWTGQGRGHKRLLDMDRDDLIAASRIRIGRAMTEARIGMLWRQLAEGLTPGQHVRDVYTPDQIDQLSRSFRVQIDALDVEDAGPADAAGE